MLPFVIGLLYSAQASIQTETSILTVDQCPPCFNCHLKMFACLNFGDCSKDSGRCNCPVGFGGDRCDAPLCGSLANKDRVVRETEKCDCDIGWTGINCNICTNDQSCQYLPLQNSTCYNHAAPVHENHVLCDVRSNPPCLTLR